MIKKHKKLYLAVILSAMMGQSYAGIAEGWDAFYQGDWQLASQEFSQDAVSNKDAAFLTAMLAVTPSSPLYNEQTGQSLLMKAMAAGSGEAAYNLVYLAMKNDIYLSEKELQFAMQKALDSNIYEMYVLVMMMDSWESQKLGINDEDRILYIQDMYKKFKTPLSAFFMGALYAQGDRFSKDFEIDLKKSEQYLLEAEAGGLDLAVVGLASLYQTDGMKDGAKSEEYAKKADQLDLSAVRPKAELISMLSMMPEKDKIERENKLRAQAKTDGKAAQKLGYLLLIKGDSKGANASWQQALALGNTDVAVDLMRSLQKEERDVFLAKMATESPDMMGKLYYMASQSFGNGYLSRVEQKQKVKYLRQSSQAGYLPAILIMAEVWQQGDRDNGIQANKRQALRLYFDVLEQTPDDMEVVKKAGLLMSRMDDATIIQKDKGFELLSKAANANPKDVELQYSLTWQLMEPKSHYYDPAKALEIFNTILSNSQPEARQYHRIVNARSGLLLREGAKNVPIDNALAFKRLNALYPDDLYSDVSMVLAEMYHHGLGTEPNIKRAIELYRDAEYSLSTSAKIDFAELLLAQKDEASIDEGLKSLISAANSDGSNMTIREKLLQYKDHPLVQQWIFDTYRYSNYVDNINALQLMKEGSDAGNEAMQLYYAEALLKNKETKDQGYVLLKQLVDQNNIQALKYMAKESGDREPYLILLTEKQQDDDSYYNLASYYYQNEQYDKAIEWFDKVKDQERSFLKSERRRAQEKLTEHQEFLAKVEANDADAQYQLYRQYDRKDDEASQKLAREWLTKAVDNGNGEAALELGKLLQKSEDANERASATRYFLMAIKADETDGYEKIYDQYRKNNDPDLDRKMIKNMLAKYAKIDDYIGVYYYRQMEDVDNAMSNMKSKDPALQLKGQKKLAWAYEAGAGIPENKAKALTMYQALAEQGDGQSQRILAQILRYGYDDVEPNWDEAIIWYQKAQKNGENVDQAIKLYETAVAPMKQNDPNAIFALAKEYNSDSTYNIKDKDKIVADMINRAANDGSIEAMKYLSNNDRENAQFWLNKASDAGDAEAKISLAKLMFAYNRVMDDQIVNLLTEAGKTEPVAIDFLVSQYLLNGEIDQALKMVELLPENQRIGTYLSFAKSYFEGSNGVEKDLPKALELYENVFAKAPNAEIAYNIAMIYLAENQTSEDEAKAIEWWKKGLALQFQDENDDRYSRSYSGYTAQLLWAGASLLDGANGFSFSQANRDLGIKWLTEAIQLDNKEAAGVLANYYGLEGDYVQAHIYAQVEDDSWQSDRYAELLSKDELASAETKIAEIQKQQNLAPFLAEIKELEAMIEEGNSGAATALGKKYLYGNNGFPQSIEKAEEYFAKAGSMGNATAYNIVGNLFRKGEEAPKDMQKAVYYFDLGAKLNDSNCAHQAGDLYYFGEGGLPQDYNKAAYYYGLTELVQGDHHFAAKYKIALIYTFGKGGIKKDPQKAYDLLKTIEHFNNKDVNEALKTWDFGNIKR